MKVAIIGYSGSGKSTLARELSRLYDVPVLHLDKVQYLPDWQMRPNDDGERIVKDFLDSNSDWVIDGNYSAFCQKRRMQEADLIIFFNFNRFVCLKNVLKRFWRCRGSVRPDMADGCCEKIDAEFIFWVLHKGRSRSKKNGYRKKAAEYSDKFIELKNRKEANRLLARLTEEAYGKS